MRSAMLARGDGAFGGGEDAAYRNFSRVLSKVSAAAPACERHPRKVCVCCWYRLIQQIFRCCQSLCFCDTGTLRHSCYPFSYAV